MSAVFQLEAPLRMDDSGAIRVGETRVLMVLVIEAFQDGATPEGIVLQYPTLSLADVYAVIAYYLRHKAEVEEYVADYNRQAEEVRARIEAAQKDLPDIRSRLLARRRKGESGGGTVGAP
ncbi:MAG TPA: DUF433 domain-containing protein [Fimbriiglobus sp.]|jgi:uncharacterized protein (DUF433 family)|nr:DUF433 domain-containing protein [Fimbriiglobus sp.]